MINIQQNEVYSIYCFQQVSLEGNREKKESFSYDKINSVLDKIIDVIKASNPNLSKMDEDMLRKVLEVKTIKEIKAKEQADLRMNKVPDETFFVNKTGDSYFGNQLEAERCFALPLKYNYERDLKEFENDADREQWQPRIDIMEQAFACHLIFSVSIIPLTRIYFRRGIKEKVYLK